MTASGSPALAALRAYLDARRADVESLLARCLPGTPACPSVIAEPVRYSLRAGGKRLRPILTLASAEAAGARCEPPLGADEARRLALPAACAIEMIHTYSLVHDDLPSMDNDVLRRGQPTVHVAFGESMAILAGDGLLTEAFGLIAREPDIGPPDLAERKVRAIARLAQAAGVAGMVGGQAIDLDLTGRAAAPDLSLLRDMHARKTGALIRAAAVVGGIMVGASDAVISALDEYGTDLGLAFQIVDDVLDVEGETAALGKTAGKDAAAGKITYPALVGIETSRRLAREAIGRAESALARGGLPSEHLGAIARWTLERSG
ncbi:MAG TPA: farnesyl diphosphate synthase [Vicinamibacterales bacterium]|nr:farnesyl diphosphate synthase [Vicinamibacterales bacterium]